jgi:hypothetical protein
MNKATSGAPSGPGTSFFSISTRPGGTGSTGSAIGGAARITSSVSSESVIGGNWSSSSSSSGSTRWRERLWLTARRSSPG